MLNLFRGSLRDDIEKAAERMERIYWNALCARGPMIEADIDWRAPVPFRTMVEGDL
jgi:hypothetical protein